MDIYPKISIVTPVLNRAEYLESTIRSVLSQGYPNLEYIIIDGGSTDGTIEIIKKYEIHLTYWVSEPDKGMYYAIQKGFDKATGDIMAWLNSDDMYHSKSLFVVADIFFSHPNVDWIIGTPSLYNKNGEMVKVFSTQKWSEQRFVSGDYRWIQQESTFFRKLLWDKIGAKINTKYKLAADFELWSRLFEQATFYSVNTVLSGFRMHGNQLSLNNNLAYENEVKEIYELYFENSVVRKKILIRWIFTLSKQNANSKLFIKKLISKILSNILKRLYRLPRSIYYDFTTNNWRM